MSDPHRDAARHQARLEQDPNDLSAQLGLRDAWVATGHADVDRQIFVADRCVERLVNRVVRGEEPALKALEVSMGQRPDDADLIWATAGACRRAGRFRYATRLYLRHLELVPDSPFTGFLLDACRQRKSGIVPAGYVKALGEEIAQDYDAFMADLDDQVPEHIAAALKRGVGGVLFEAVDLGCGTGRLGALIRPFTKRLTGVDFSPHMLAEAKGRGCYDTLVEAEVIEFLDGHSQAFNRVLACDLLGYFGDLNQFMPKAARALRKGGQLILSIEPCERGHQLDPSGRYQHSAHHLRRRAKQAGFEIKQVDAVILRQEERPIEGLIFTLRKS